MLQVSPKNSGSLSGLASGSLLWPVVFLSLLSGCGPLKWIKIQLPKHHLKAEVRLAADVNFDSPLAVDMVAVANKKLYKALKETSARDWFENKRQYFADYQPGKDFQVFQFEWVPGQTVPRIVEPIRRKTRGIVIFANYAGEGDHRARLKKKKTYWLDFQKEWFLATRVKGGGP